MQNDVYRKVGDNEPKKYDRFFEFVKDFLNYELVNTNAENLLSCRFQIYFISSSDLQNI